MGSDSTCTVPRRSRWVVHRPSITGPPFGRCQKKQGCAGTDTSLRVFGDPTHCQKCVAGQVSIAQPKVHKPETSLLQQALLHWNCLGARALLPKPFQARRQTSIDFETPRPGKPTGVWGRPNRPKIATRGLSVLPFPRSRKTCLLWYTLGRRRYRCRPHVSNWLQPLAIRPGSLPPVIFSAVLLLARGWRWVLVAVA